MSSADNTDDSASDSITSKPRPKHGEGESLKSSKKNTEKEWLEGLRSDDLSKCTAAIEAVVAATSGGENTSALYIEMLKNLGRPNLSERTARLISTYLVQLSTVKPEIGLLAAGSFTKNASSSSVLTRSWALAAFCAMRVPNFAEYSIPLLRKQLQDKDPFVRKTAVICVAKLFDIDTEVIKESEVIAKLREGLSAESSPIAVSNSVAVLRQISEESRQDHIKMDQNQLLKLVVSLSDTNEWGQIELLDCLAQYDPTPHDAEQIVLRILPRLRHINSAVVMSTIKVMVAYMDKLTHANLRNDLLNKRIPSALITIIAHSPSEIQYVALTNIRLIVQKYPEMLRKHLASFFCKHEEPLYVKKEKLKVLELLSTEDNKETLLQELVLYSQDANVTFARYATGCIADLAIKYPKLADSCVNHLRDACTPNALHHVHEVLSFLPTVVRRYPKKYDAIAAKLVERFYAELEEPEARASSVWILGECSSHFSEFIDVLTACISDFTAEPALVQLQLITATAKLFLLYSLESGSGARKKAQAISALLDKVLSKGRTDGANADVSDRAYFYTRLLSAADSTELAAKVVLCDKPTPQPQRTELTPEQLHALLLHLGTVQSVVQSVQDLRPPFKFQRQGGDEKTILEPEETGATEEADGDNLIAPEAAEDSDEGDAEADKQSTGDNDSDSESSRPKPQASPPPQAKKPVELDLLSAFQ